MMSDLPIPNDFVDARSGSVVIERVDLDQAPLRLVRRHCSRDAEMVGVLGRGWLTPFDARVEIDGNALRVVDRDGVVHHTRLGGRAVDGLRASPTAPTSRRTSRGLELHYDDGGRDVLDGEGRLLHRVGGTAAPCTIVRDRTGVITRIDTPQGALELSRTRSELTMCLVVRRQIAWWRRYRYAGGALVAVDGPEGSIDEYEHDGSLLVGARLDAEPRRYFEYDGRAPGSRCVRTWREDGSLDHAYTRVGAHRVLVEDTRGDAWQILWDERGTTRIDPDGTSHRVEASLAIR